MKTILAFGDSLTWGSDPATGLRHPLEYRWPEVLQRELGGTARVIAEGLGGRTTFYDDHTGPACRNGAKALQVALASHMPLDLSSSCSDKRSQDRLWRQGRGGSLGHAPACRDH